MAGIAIAAALGFGWWVVISVMTQIGFSGNDRYLILGAALVEIAGGVGFGWAALELSHWLSRRFGAGSGRLASGVGTWAVAGAIGACFLLLPQWIGGLVHIRKIHKALVYQAHLREDLTKAVAQVGGPARVLRCGSVMTEGFQVPMVAWALGVHTLQIEAPPNGGPRAPGAERDLPHPRPAQRDSAAAVVRLAQRALSACGSRTNLQRVLQLHR